MELNLCVIQPGQAIRRVGNCQPQKSPEGWAHPHRAASQQVDLVHLRHPERVRGWTRGAPLLRSPTAEGGGRDFSPLELRTLNPRTFEVLVSSPSPPPRRAEAVRRLEERVGERRPFLGQTGSWGGGRRELGCRASPASRESACSLLRFWMSSVVRGLRTSLSAQSVRQQAQARRYSAPSFSHSVSPDPQTHQPKRENEKVEIPPSADRRQRAPRR